MKKIVKSFKARGTGYNSLSLKLRDCLTLARLLSRRPQQLSALARLFEVSERSIQRYLLTLKEAGFEFQRGGNKGWYQIGKWR